MNSDTLEVGTLVAHPTKPEWETGKIVKTIDGKTYVVWRNLLPIISNSTII